MVLYSIIVWPVLHGIVRYISPCHCILLQLCRIRSLLTSPSKVFEGPSYSSTTSQDSLYNLTGLLSFISNPDKLKMKKEWVPGLDKTLILPII